MNLFFIKTCYCQLLKRYLFYHIYLTIKKILQMKNLKIILNFKKMQKANFIGVANYENKFGEVSNLTFVVGITYKNLMEKNLKKLTSISTLRKVVEMFSNNDKTLVKKAYNELVSSLVKRLSSEEEKQKLRLKNDQTIKRSDAQKNAYIILEKGLKVKDNQLYVYGIFLRKTIQQKGVYPKVNSQPKTIIKNKIKKYAELGKFKTLKVGNMEEINLMSDSIKI